MSFIIVNLFSTDVEKAAKTSTAYKKETVTKNNVQTITITKSRSNLKILRKQDTHAEPYLPVNTKTFKRCHNINTKTQASNSLAPLEQIPVMKNQRSKI